MKTNSSAIRLFKEVNRLRRSEQLEPISFLRFAYGIGRFHEDRNPRVAEAFKNLGMSEPSKQSR